MSNEMPAPNTASKDPLKRLTTRAPAMSIFASVFCLFFFPEVRYNTNLKRKSEKLV
jgi:hypothetical protein